MRELNNDEIKPLANAIAAGNVVLVQELLDNYGDVDAHMTYGRTALHHAAGCDSIEVARMLINIGADANAIGTPLGVTPLQLACISGSLSTAGMLLDAGVNVDIKSRTGRTALHYALYQPDGNRSGREILGLILRYSPDVNAADEGGVTPADMAIDYAELSDLILLLDRGADPNAKINGASRLHRLAASGLPIEYFEKLIEAGADVDSLDHDNCRPLDVALKNGRNDLSSIFSRT